MTPIQRLPIKSRRVAWPSLAATLLIVAAATPLALTQASDAPDAATQAQTTLRPLPLDGVHNVFRLDAKVFSGSQPEGEAGFKSLRDLGIKTIISVDGMRPDAATARKYGMRTVHLPFGYGGVPRDRQLQIARAVRDLPGPIFIHCHHGKHRGPAAAMIGMRAARGWSAAQCESAMSVIGTSRQYAGLYESVHNFQKPSAAQLDAVDASFPPSVAVPPMAIAMTQIDERWEHLEEAQAAGWKAPPSHPDIDPPHEALMLAEEFRELHRAPAAQQRDEPFRAWLRASELAAADLSSALRAGDNAKADAVATQLGANCGACHVAYRNG